MFPLFLIACPPKGPQGVHITVTEDQFDLRPERDEMLAVLDAAAPEVESCYLTELRVDARSYGDLVFVATLAADGSVQDVEVSLSTMSRRMDRCVAAVFIQLEFPAPVEAGTTMRYPLVFTTELTPPEVARALKLKHGLIDAEQEALEAEEAALDPKKREEQGERGWTDSW
ncbi:MAG TPA: AgmX/PglI C-terminal domain-containing protein [Myxococcota bacterium]|nr:AgmX/PglI C-terminal domain-containing protein [Myxococcota bacterium]